MRTIIAVALALPSACGPLCSRPPSSRPMAPSISSTGRSGSRPKKGCRTGSGRCCRECSPTNCPAATRHWGLSGSPIENCRSDSRRRASFGSERIAVNCAFCHTATYRTSPDTPRVIVPGGATTLTRPQAFSRFLEAAAADSRFNAGDMLEAIGKMTTLSWTESFRTASS